MQTSDFDYALPGGLIAQTPVEPRDGSRLMVLNRREQSLHHRRFYEIIDYLRAGDVLVFNDSRVIPARLWASRDEDTRRFEILLLNQRSASEWETLVRPAKKAGLGTRLNIIGNSPADTGPGRRVQGEITGIGEGGIRVIRFSGDNQITRLGQIPLPPYIRTPLADPERYQTVFARAPGSVAAPTAGLHFTPELIDRITDRGVRCLFVTLHVGLGTFRPVRASDPHRHTMYQEYGVVSEETTGELSRAMMEGRRIIGVGTTTTRLLEAAALASDPLKISPFTGWVSLFILPGHRFRLINGLVTNFHLPRSTLLMMVTAFAGGDYLRLAYREAIDRKYRFYSFGDAMLIM